MKKISSFSKGLCLILLSSIFFTSCDIPDISVFTTLSTEMTRGIRQGVKDTGDVLKTAAANDELFEPETIKGFQKYSNEYNTVMQPTLETLDALDSYVEALNALAQANKKSAENSKAVFTALNKLISSASNLVIAPPAAAVAIPDAALKIGEGILGAIEKFRTAKSFKERVNAARNIVEGEYIRKDELVGGKIVKIDIKKCTDINKAEIERDGREFAETRTSKLKEIEESDQYKNLTTQLKAEKDPKKKKDIEKEIKDFITKALEEKPSDGGKSFDEIEKDFQAKIKNYGCGIIDLLTFTMQDLRRINKDVSVLTEENFLSKNRTTFGMYQGIDTYYSNVQDEIIKILDFKTKLIGIRKLELDLRNSPDDEKLEMRIVNLKKTARRTLNDIYNLDGQARTDVEAKITECDEATQNGQPPKNKCAGMMDYITCQKCLGKTKQEVDEFTGIIKKITKEQFDHGSGMIETALNARAVKLFAENQGYLTEKERIRPDYERVNAELTEMRQKQIKLDKLLTASIATLKTWTETHANLRETINRKKPLQTAALKARVEDILTFFNSEETE